VPWTIVFHPEFEPHMTTLRDKMAKLPARRRTRVKARAQELIAEETSLQALRKAHRKTQEKVAATLGIGQDSVSRLEQRSDMLLSTLRDYVAAIGGSVRLLVEFKGKPAIELKGLGAIKGTSASGRRKVGRRASGRRHSV
jgi:DNA-binding XRE family transcriptional regulator